MFDERELTNAVEIQARSYRLLRWVRDGVGQGFISVTRAHEYTSETSSAKEWLSERFLDIPADCRPLARDGPALEQFARCFVSYLRASFDLQAEPGSRLVSDSGCYCSFCSYLVAASHFKPKKLSAADKARARKLKRKYLEDLARENDVALDAKKLDSLLADKNLAKPIALATYGKDLLRRCTGQGLASAATLALWREFAGTPDERRNRKFQLKATNILEAERQLSAALVG
jgi:hypothetical protein